MGADSMKPTNESVPCPVCGKYTFTSYMDHNICRVCGWENDDWFEEGGANHISLEDYKRRYQEYLELYSDYTYAKYGLPEMTESDRLTVDHLYCTSNEKELQKSTFCGCFYCVTIFEPHEINTWINDKDGKTAMCPYCGIDSVLPDSMVELSEEYLQKMKEVWF